MYAYFAGGCFWCITPNFASINGVKEVISGYCGGDEPNPTYNDVKGQKTGHRETIRVEFDPNIVSYNALLDVFLGNIDLYDEGGQFIDRGHSYTLAIYYDSKEIKEIIESRLSEFERKPCISVEELKTFYKAEEYHQDYYLKHPKEFEEELIKSGRKK